MSQPAVVQTEIDNALGVLPQGSGTLAVIGTSTLGTVNAPATFARVKDLVAAFGIGPAVEAAAHYIDRYAKPVLFCKTTATTAGAMGAITFVGTGTSIPTLTGGFTPVDDYDFQINIVNGGTIGITGITLQWSVDGGRTFSPITALGTANTFLVGDTGIQISFAAGTLVALDTFSSRCTAPQWITGDLATGLTALRNSAQPWELCEVAGLCAAADISQLDASFSAMAAAGKFRAFIAHVRTQNAAETYAAYTTAMTVIAAASSSKFGMVCAGSMETVSPVTGRQYRRPPSFTIAAREASVTEETDTADVKLGPLPVTIINDTNGNQKYYNESISPGLDDQRFCTLRTWEGRTGVYVNRPRAFSPAGSDFKLLAHRRVMNLARATTRAYMETRLNSPIIVNPTTGFILEKDALEIESGASEQLRSVLAAKPKASSWVYSLSRVDNILSTSNLTTQMRIVPLGYVETITEEDGFRNPALAAQTS